MLFLDTNIFLRYLLGDDAQKTDACYRLFARLAHGEEVAMTSETVVAEIVYVMTSRRTYGVTAAEVCQRLRPLLEIDALRISEKRMCLRALDVFEQHPFLGFEDALYIAQLETARLEGIYSYDQDLDRVPGVRRIEP